VETGGDPGTHGQVTCGRTAARKRRVLVVDDNRDLAKTWARLLGLSGHEVRIAFDGLQGLNLAKVFRPDVALLDVGLPDIDGYELARHLRAEIGPAVILIIMITACERKPRESEAGEAVFDFFFTKPVDFAVIRTLLT
jgi:DNA-binding response OmpR family regulator